MISSIPSKKWVQYLSVLNTIYYLILIAPLWDMYDNLHFSDEEARFIYSKEFV